MTIRKLKFAWKYRKYLWRYRNVIRHRRQIAWWTGAGVVVATAGILIRRNRIEQVDAQPQQG
jgi:hypothetical protein